MVPVAAGGVPVLMRPGALNVVEPAETVQLPLMLTGLAPGPVRYKLIVSARSREATRSDTLHKDR